MIYFFVFISKLIFIDCKNGGIFGQISTIKTRDDAFPTRIKRQFMNRNMNCFIKAIILNVCASESRHIVS